MHLLLINIKDITVGDTVAVLAAVSSLVYFFWKVFRNMAIERTLNETNNNILKDKYVKLEEKLSCACKDINVTISEVKAHNKINIERLQASKLEVALYLESQRRYDDQILRLREDLNRYIDVNTDTNNKMIERLDNIFLLLNEQANANIKSNSK